MNKKNLIRATLVILYMYMPVVGAPKEEFVKEVKKVLSEHTEPWVKESIKVIRELMDEPKSSQKNGIVIKEENRLQQEKLNSALNELRMHFISFHEVLLDFIKQNPCENQFFFGNYGFQVNPSDYDELIDSEETKIAEEYKNLPTQKYGNLGYPTDRVLDSNYFFNPTILKSMHTLKFLETRATYKLENPEAEKKYQDSRNKVNYAAYYGLSEAIKHYANEKCMPQQEHQNAAPTASAASSSSSPKPAEVKEPTKPEETKPDEDQDQTEIIDTNTKTDNNNGDAETEAPGSELGELEESEEQSEEEEPSELQLADKENKEESDSTEESVADKEKRQLGKDKKVKTVKIEKGVEKDNPKAKNPQQKAQELALKAVVPQPKAPSAKAPVVQEEKSNSGIFGFFSGAFSGIINIFSRIWSNIVG